VTGLLFPAESRGSLVEAAARLGRDPATRARLGKQAREQMVQERGWRQVVGRYLPVYGSLG
jgi:glycosyltransferase involved in cell wall biosynthesis